MSEKTVVVALGHKALGTTLPEQKTATRAAAKAIADLSARIQAEKVAFEASQLSAQMQLASQKALNEKMLQEQALINHQKAFQPLGKEEIRRRLTK